MVFGRWFLNFVYFSAMKEDVVSPVALILANEAFVRFDIAVDSHVVGKFGSGDETFATLVASILSLRVMNAVHMLFQPCFTTI